MIKSEQELNKSTRIVNLIDYTPQDSESSSDGCCAKYTNGKYWVKLDRNGYESLAEVISSRVAKALNLNTVEYSPCFGIIDGFGYSGCLACSFVPDNYEETTLGRILCRELMYSSLSELMRRINSFNTPFERISFVADTLEKYIPREQLLCYLAEILWFDSVIYNGDRHLYNILVLRDSKGDYCLAPLFDFGDGLLSNTSFRYPLQMTASYGVYKVKAKPFSTTFSKQVSCLLPWLRITKPRSLDLFVGDLYDYYDKAEISRALAVLHIGLEHYDIQLNIKEDCTQHTHWFN